MENTRLCLQGGPCPTHRFDPNLLARRITTFTSSVTTRLHANPRHFQHEASLMAFYDNAAWFALTVSLDRDARDGKGARVLRMQWNDCGAFDIDPDHVVPLKEGPVELRWTIEGQDLTAFYRQEGDSWTRFGDVQDAGKLSDDYDTVTGYNFTGAWYGIQVTDACGDGFQAAFDFLDFTDGSLPQDDSPS